MNSVSVSENRSIADDLTAARTRLARTAFGADALEDDENLLTSISLLLEEIGMQLESRDIQNAKEVRVLREGVLEYVSMHLASVGARSAAAMKCTCLHDPTLHVSYGCSWEDSTGGEPNICKCAHAAAFTAKQHRPYLISEIARKAV